MDRLTWTRARPTVPGWYWWRENQLCTNQEHWTVLRIRQEHIDKHDVITIGTQVYFVQETPGEWAGPIPHPEEPRG